MVAGQMGTPGRIEVMKRAVAALAEADVPVLAGSDTMNPLVVPGAALLEEIHLLAEAGLGAEGALAAATWQAGEALGIEGLGRIEAGAPADLLVFERDPTRDLSNLDSLRAVVASGRYYPVEELEAAVERALEHFEGIPYEPLSMGLAERGLTWLGSFSGGG
jgi:imidazolonepropionase-like amidohydrolase